MTEVEKSETQALFDSLRRLYKQAQLLLMDSDRHMGERGWESLYQTALTAGLSYSLNLPEKWFTRWAVRFYVPSDSDKKEQKIDQILFVSVHFTSDHDTRVKDPLVSAGRLSFHESINLKGADKSIEYWMCKYWFHGKDHDTLQNWHKTGQSKLNKNLKSSETFARPLYEITSSDKLKQLIINPLLAVAGTDTKDA